MKDLIQKALQHGKVTELPPRVLRSGVYIRQIHVILMDGSEITITAETRVVIDHAAKFFDKVNDEWEYNRFATETRDCELTVYSIKPVGDRRPTFNPSEEEVEEMINNGVK